MQLAPSPSPHMLPLPLQAQGIRRRPKRLAPAEIKRRQRLLSAAQEPRYAPDNTRMASAYEVAFDHVSSGGTPRNEIENLVQWEQEEQLGTIEEGEHGAAHSGAEGEHGAAHSGAAEPRRRQGLKRGRGQVCLDAESTCLREWMKSL